MAGFRHSNLPAISSIFVLLCASVFATADDSAPDAAQKDVAPPINPIEKSVQALAQVAKKSVVVVTFTGRDGQRQGLGSGFIVSEDGLIATNLHVIGEARPIKVELFDGRKFDVTAVYATERSQDLAVIKIDAKGLPVLDLGDSDTLEVGQPVVAIGNPLGLDRSVVSGILSGKRVIDGRSMLQIALPIEPGNSGGPLLDLQGRVHGILTLKSLKTTNLGFAIETNSLKPLLQKPNPIPMNRWLTIGAIDPLEWTVLPGGRWRQRAGQLSVDGRGGGFGGRALCLAVDDVPEVPFEVAVQVKFSPADGAAGLVFHADGGDKHYGFYPTNGSLRLSRFDGPDVYSWAVLKEVPLPNHRPDDWNHLKVRIESERIQCYFNGTLVIEASDAKYKSGRVGLCKFRQTEAEFKGFRFGKELIDLSPTEADKARVAAVIGGITADATSLAEISDLLVREDASVIGTLEQQAKEMEWRAAQIRRLAAEVHAKQTLTEFERLLKSSPLNLFHAALLIAKLDNPELDVDSYNKQIERHASRVKATFAADATESDKLAALNRYLFEEQGFHGGRTDYGNRSNSYVNEVLDDREGLPITLSVIYIELARHLGLNVVGIGMPSHFLVRHEPASGDTQLVDVFDRGRLLQPEQAREVFGSLSDRPWRDSFLDSTTSQTILDRMLRNLSNQAKESQELERLLRYTDAVLVLNPDSADDHLLRGIVTFHAKKFQQAQAEVDWLNKHGTDISHEMIDELARAIARGLQK